MPSLIVPQGYGKGKPNRRLLPTNPFAAIVRSRQNASKKRYVGKVWKGVGQNAGGLGEAPGRKVGKVAGAHIEDMVELRKSIVLCTHCTHKFYYRRAKYYKDGRFGPKVLDRCDGCRSYNGDGQLFLPEERLVDFSGIAKPGQVWRPV